MTIRNNNALTRQVDDAILERELYLPIERSELVARARGIIGPVIKVGKSVAISQKTEIHTESNTYGVFFVGTEATSGNPTTTIYVESEDGERAMLGLDYCDDLSWADAYAAGEIIVEVEKQLQAEQ